MYERCSPPLHESSPQPRSTTLADHTIPLVLKSFILAALIVLGTVYLRTPVSTPKPSSLFITTMSVSRQVTKSVLAVAQSEGVGAIVKRSIGSPALRNLSPFLM